MIPEPALRWIFTVAFAAAGAFCLYRGFRAGTAVQRVSGVLHLALCGGMIAMAWPATMDLAPAPQVLLFGFAAVWFTGLLVSGARGHDGYHAVMAAAMVWMVLVMSAGASPAPAAVLAVVFAAAGTVRLGQAARVRAAGPAADAVMGWGMALLCALLA
ncbi:DUF5134 domain-containing protein [Amycolatopsis sp. NPDC051061]|uniref:DUF5134 domain-containing protein n=1 Tax=Amycolatopsis sp. NPDC051061 TaxID=3155042 RepID=UPI003418F4AB